MFFGPHSHRTTQRSQIINQLINLSLFIGYVPQAYKLAVVWPWHKNHLTQLSLLIGPSPTFHLKKKLEHVSHKVYSVLVDCGMNKARWVQGSVFWAIFFNICITSHTILQQTPESPCFNLAGVIADAVQVRPPSLHATTDHAPPHGHNVFQRENVFSKVFQVTS